MIVTPERARGEFLGMVLAGRPLHPDALTLGLRLTDGQLAGALALAAEWTVRRPGEHFSIRQRDHRPQRQADPLRDSSGGPYFDLDAVSTAVIVTALLAEME